MTRIFGVVGAAVLPVVLSVAELRAEPGVLIEAESDTVIKIDYLGRTVQSNSPVLFVTGGKSYGAIVEGTWRGLTGRVPGYAMPYPGTPSGMAAAGPIGIAAYAASSNYYTIGAHVMSNSSHAIGVSYGIEVRAENGWNAYGIKATAYGGANQSWAAWFDGSTYSNGGTYQGSDRMFKKNIEDLSGGLDKVMALKPKSYDMKIEEFKDKVQLPKGRQIGLIAQDLRDVLPELVIDAEAPPELTADEMAAGVEKEGLKFQAVNYTGLIPVLIAAIQEQQARIEALEASLK